MLETVNGTDQAKQHRNKNNIMETYLGNIDLRENMYDPRIVKDMNAYFIDKYIETGDVGACIKISIKPDVTDSEETTFCIDFTETQLIRLKHAIESYLENRKFDMLVFQDEKLSEDTFQ